MHAFFISVGHTTTFCNMLIETCLHRVRIIHGARRDTLHLPHQALDNESGVSMINYVSIVKGLLSV
jgi:hypothetical protein